MARWQPGADNRLSAAALQLYSERGFEQTTVADIAERAGVTARTFFRHFADKREVLFAGTTDLERLLVEALLAAPESAAPMDAVAAALARAGELLGTRREFSTQRQAVIDAHAELRERELIKMAGWSEAFAAALRTRGVDEPEASLAAQAGIAVFRVAWQRWLTGPADAELAAVIEGSLAQLRSVTAPPARGRAR